MGWVLIFLQNVRIDVKTFLEDGLEFSFLFKMEERRNRAWIEDALIKPIGPLDFLYSFINWPKDFLILFWAVECGLSLFGIRHLT